MAELIFKIITPERVVFSDTVDQVSVMTALGEITVLPRHIPLVALVSPGELRYKKNNHEQFIAVSTGFVEVQRNNTVVILADSAEPAAEIDIERAEAARARAEELMRSARDQESADYAALQAKLEKELTRLRLGNKYRKISSLPRT